MERRDLKPGVPPFVQLREANVGRVGRRRFSYLPHIGAKQLAKAAKRAAKMKSSLLQHQKEQKNYDQLGMCERL